MEGLGVRVFHCSRYKLGNHGRRVRQRYSIFWKRACGCIQRRGDTMNLLSILLDHPELTPDEVLGQMSTPQAGIAWGVLAGLFLALFLVVRLPKNKPAPELK